MNAIRYFCAKCGHECVSSNLIPKSQKDGGIKWCCSNCHKFFEYTYPSTNLIARFEEANNG